MLKELNYGDYLPNEKLFRNPSSEFKGVPFWSINDFLDPREVARQVLLLKEGGYGGAFFHAREGLVTPFLSEEWFDAFKAALTEAKKHDMYIWIYDELRWPSGFAGGIIPALDPKYRAKALIMICNNRAYEGKEVVATFKCMVDSNGMPINYEPAKPGESSSKYLYLTFLKYTAPLGETWYSGFSYVDLLDPEVVSKFIEVAYAPYVERFKEDIGKSIPGIFTDEPNISSSRPLRRGRMPPRGPRFPPYSLPWSDTLPKVFKEINGYDLIHKLPELFFNIGDYKRTRYDFWKTVTLLFLEAFSKQIYEWCERHGLKFTGHYLAEDTLLSQMLSIGAAMPHYEYMHIPGIDHLGMQIWNSLLTAKQVASVANQLGVERVLCETYGCTGNYPSFEDRKWIGDWLYVMGINLLNHHLVPYSLRGRRKRDYGLNFHWSQPWWKYNTLIENYFARLSYVLSRGKRIVNILVIHPIGSAWAYYSPLNDSQVRDLDEKFRRLLRLLLTLHLDFDLGDEILMEKYAKIGESKLWIGKASYDVVIIPPCYTLSESTVKLLSDFVNMGGVLIAVAPTPTLVHGEPSKELEKLLQKSYIVRKLNINELSKVLEKVPKPIIIEGDKDGNILYQLRQENEKRILFIVNISKEKEYRSLKVSIPGEFKVEKWDPFTGSISSLPAEVKDGETQVLLDLNPVGSALLVFKPGSPTRHSSSRLIKIKEVDLGGKWSIRRLDSNILVLDYCRYKINGAWSSLLPVPFVQKRLAEIGLGTRFALRFEFYSEIDLRGSDIYLVIENPKQFKKIAVNGIELKDRARDYWLDWNFVKFNISDIVGKGLNTIEVEGIVSLEPEIENLYIIGDFGVKARSKCSSLIIEEPKEIELGDLCKQGYPFYSGSVELVKNIEVYLTTETRVFVELEGLKAALGVLYVNDKEVSKVLGSSSKIEVTKFLKQGINEIKLLLVGTLRNTLGPLHYAGGDPAFVSPETFSDQANWTDEYVLKPFGIEKVKLSFFKEV